MKTIDTLRAALTMSYDWITQLAEDLSDTPLTAPTPNGGSHPVWIMGHLAHARTGLMAMITGRPNSLKHWDDLFRGGTQPLQDPAAYPSYAEIMTAYRQTHRDTLGLLDEVGESGLDARPEAVPEQFSKDPHFQSNGRLFLFIAMHEMSHRGQLADARRALGRKPFA